MQVSTLTQLKSILINPEYNVKWTKKIRDLLAIQS